MKTDSIQNERDFAKYCIAFCKSTDGLPSLSALLSGRNQNEVKK